jgi:glucokinase
VAIISTFLQAHSIDRRAIDRTVFGVAGPVLDGTATLTNVPWRIEASGIAVELGIARAGLINDLEAMAYAVPVLEGDELHTLQEGEANPHGNISLIAAGTGLGIALLHRIEGRLVPSPSEGGHADFAARTEREIDLLRDLTARFGRAEVEHVISGRGLVNIHRVIHRGACTAIDAGAAVTPPAITAAALAGRCPGCMETLDVFVEAYGAEAGNVALGAVATGGVYIGGGIAPRIMPALTTGAFLKAFCRKTPFESLLESMPVKVILNSEAGLVGAAVCAAANFGPV